MCVCVGERNDAGHSANLFVSTESSPGGTQKVVVHFSLMLSIHRPR